MKIELMVHVARLKANRREASCDWTGVVEFTAPTTAEFAWQTIGLDRFGRRHCTGLGENDRRIDHNF